MLGGRLTGHWITAGVESERQEVHAKGLEDGFSGSASGEEPRRSTWG